MTEARVRRLVELAVVVGLASLLISEAFLLAPSEESYIDLRETLQLSGRSVYLNGTVGAPDSAQIVQALLWGSSAPAPVQWTVYYDGDYPISASNPTDLYGIPQHLEAVGAYRGVPVTTAFVNASGLKSYLATPPAPGAVLVMATGVFPATVYGPGVNLPLAWMREGGTLVWIGDRIGYFVGYANRGISCASATNPGWNGTAQFLNTSLLGFAPRNPPTCADAMEVPYLTPSPWSAALSMRYPYSLQYDTFNESLLLSEGGVALGATQNGFTNVALVPEGAGRLVDFGGPLEDGTQFSIDLLNLAMAGALTANRTLFDQQTYNVPAGSTQGILERVPLPSDLPSGSGTVCAFAAQSEDLADFAQVRCVPG